MGVPYFRACTMVAEVQARKDGRSLLSSLYLGNHCCWIFGAGISERPKQHCFAEACIPELLKEGISFLCACNSGEPVVLIGAIIFGKRFCQNKLRNPSGAARTQHARKFREDFLALRIQVEYSVYDRRIHRAVC